MLVTQKHMTTHSLSYICCSRNQLSHTQYRTSPNQYCSMLSTGGEGIRSRNFSLGRFHNIFHRRRKSSTFNAACDKEEAAVVFLANVARSHPQIIVECLQRLVLHVEVTHEHVPTIHSHLPRHTLPACRNTANDQVHHTLKYITSNSVLTAIFQMNLGWLVHLGFLRGLVPIKISRDTQNRFLQAVCPSSDSEIGMTSGS